MVNNEHLSEVDLVSFEHLISSSFNTPWLGLKKTKNISSSQHQINTQNVLMHGMSSTHMLRSATLIQIADRSFKFIDFDLRWSHESDKWDFLIKATVAFEKPQIIKVIVNLPNQPTSSWHPLWRGSWSNPEESLHPQFSVWSCPNTKRHQWWEQKSILMWTCLFAEYGTGKILLMIQSIYIHTKYLHSVQWCCA